MSVVCDRACRAQLLNFWSKVMLQYWSSVCDLETIHTYLYVDYVMSVMYVMYMYVCMYECMYALISR